MSEFEKYETVGEFEIDEVLPHVVNSRKKKKREFVTAAGKSFPVKVTSDRLILFQAKGTTCVNCGLEGSVFLLQRFKGAKSADDRQPHLNLWGRDADGNWALFTKDHVLPRSKGGRDHLSNYQTMCLPCNQKKGNRRSIASA